MGFIHTRLVYLSAHVKQFGIFGALRIDKQRSSPLLSSLPLVSRFRESVVSSTSSIGASSFPYYFSTKTGDTSQSSTTKIFEIQPNFEELAKRMGLKWTAWAEAVQAANFIELDRTQDWSDDQNMIQVKRMTEQDLRGSKEGNVPFPESDDAYERALDVIKLPLRLPMEKDVYAPQFLFVRPDEYELFRCLLGHKGNSIMIGNPGISKSWFQWKFILFCYRPNLFNYLWPSMFTQHEAPLEETLVIPSTIIRTVAGKKSYRFPIKSSAKVTLIRHEPADLELFTDETTTILWEPGAGEAPVESVDILARIIATVSPNEKRIHEFRKNAKLFFMPCPSELQIRLMGQILRAVKNVNSPSDDDICHRVQKYGPFIRLCIFSDDKELASFEDSRGKDLDLVCQSGTNIVKAFQSSTDILEASGQFGWTHRVARYDVPRDRKTLESVYRSHFFRPSCPEVLSIISHKMAYLRIDELKAYLVDIDRGCTRDDVNIPKVFEHLFMAYALDNIQWKSRQLLLVETPGVIETCIDWSSFHLKMDGLIRDVVPFQEMKENVLYYPNDVSFPLVDFYYKDKKGKLVGIQATIASKHPQKMSVYESFYRKIGTTPEETPLTLYFFILPRQVNSYNRIFYSMSKCWADVSICVPPRWEKNMDFHALLPPSTFDATF